MIFKNASSTAARIFYSNFHFTGKKTIFRKEKEKTHLIHKKSVHSCFGGGV